MVAEVSTNFSAIPRTFSYFYLSSGSLVAAQWKIAAHSAYDMFSMYKYLIVNLVFPPRFLECEFFLIAPFPDCCLLVPIYPFCIFCFQFFG